MSKKTNQSYPDKAIEGTLLTADYINKLKKSNSILQQAEKKASRLISQAHKQVDDIREQAYSDGYISAIAYAFEYFIQYLFDVSATEKRLSLNIEQALTNKIKNLFFDVEAIQNLLSAWTNNFEEQRIIIFIPSSEADLACDLSEKLRGKFKKNIHVEHHEHENIIISCADQILNIDTSHFSRKIIRELVYSSTDISDEAHLINKKMHHMMKERLEKIEIQD